MNIKKNTSNRPLLTIDDPTIYKGENSPFINSMEVATTTLCTEENILYLVGSGSNRVPYIKTPTGVEVLPNPFSRGPTLPYPDANNIYQLNDNLVAIDNHLYALRKELSYWNLYQISYSVDNADDFSATLASLGPNEALIINLNGLFIYEGEQYSRGDIVLRLTDGTYTTIKASSSGFYYPQKIVQNGNNYKLYYAYWQDAEPVEGEIDITGTQVSVPYKTEYFEVEGASASESFIYGIREEIGSGTNFSYSFDAAMRGLSTPIPPIIKLFTIDGEEIAEDFTCTFNTASTKYTLTINNKPDILKYVYIK